MEPVLGKKVTGDSSTSDEQRPCNPLQTLHTVWLLIVAYMEYYQGITLAIVSVLIVTLVIVALEKIAYASTTKTHKPGIRSDYSSAIGLNELQMGKLDHWCLQGGDDYCQCDDPTIGIPNEKVKGWNKAHKLNKKLVEDLGFSEDLDVVFLGDAAVEELNGRWLGMEREDLKGIKKYFTNSFSVAGGGEVNGLALGIAGDTISNLRWRVKHGELTTSLNPTIWWILIGSNDLGRGQCAEEAVLVGILQLAHEISIQKPESVVVINSILPRHTPIKLKHQKKPIDLWPYIEAVNSQLQSFCTKNEKSFFYFDAHELFVTEEVRKGHKKLVVKKDLMDESSHLTLAGHKVWGKAMLSVVTEFKEKMAKSVGDTTTYVHSEYNKDVVDDNHEDDFTGENPAAEHSSKPAWSSNTDDKFNDLTDMDDYLRS